MQTDKGRRRRRGRKKEPTHLVVVVVVVVVVLLVVVFVNGVRPLEAVSSVVLASGESCAPVLERKRKKDGEFKMGTTTP